jgi:hypothetical protein
MGDAFEPAFTAWSARATLADGQLRSARDADAFIRFVRSGKSLSGPARAAIREDRAHIRAALRPRWLKILSRPF